MDATPARLDGGEPMSFIHRADVMFAIEEDGTLAIERGAGFRVEQAGYTPVAGDLIHYENVKVHRVWRLTGERDDRGSYRGVAT